MATFGKHNLMICEYYDNTIHKIDMSIETDIINLQQEQNKIDELNTIRQSWIDFINLLKKDNLDIISKSNLILSIEPSYANELNIIYKEEDLLSYTCYYDKTTCSLIILYEYLNTDKIIELIDITKLNPISKYNIICHLEIDIIDDMFEFNKILPYYQNNIICVNKIKYHPAVNDNYSYIKYFNNLQELEIIGNYNTECKLPSLSKLTTLKRLTINKVNIFKAIDSISKLYNLEYLDISNNKLTTLPKSFSNLSQLKSLDISNNNFTGLPKAIYSLVELRELTIRNNKISRFSKHIVNLINLVLFNFGDTLENGVPDYIYCMPSIDIDNIRTQDIFYYGERDGFDERDKIINSLYLN